MTAKDTNVFVFEGTRKDPINLEPKAGRAKLETTYTGAKGKSLLIISQQKSSKKNSSLRFIYKARGT